MGAKKKTLKPDSLYVSDRKPWRAWLRNHHNRKAEIWLVYYKKHTGKPSIPYDDAVEEAICFGWIDGMVKRVDNERYTQRFTPRTKSSKWSKLNMQRARRMIAQGRMTEAGLAKFRAAVEEPDTRIVRRDSSRDDVIPADLRKALRSKKNAEKHFAEAAPSYRRLCIRWISNAKKNETRERRIAEVVREAARGKRKGFM